MQLSALTASLGRFLAELQRRKVLRIAAAYVVGAWIVLQVALALQTAMSLSGQFSAAILALLVIGFFVTLVLAWFYEITPEGVKRTAPATGDTPLVKPQTTDIALAGALTLVVIVALVQLLTPSPTAPPAAAPATTAETTPAKPEPPTLGDKSIAVLPFANLSPDKENEYFADGLTEELLNLLAKIGDLKVISRTSSFAFKGKNTPLPEIAKQLGVRHILAGSVRTEGDALRIAAQLIDVSTDTHLWSETYERTLKDVFALQEEIARDIAGALRVEVTLAGGGEAPTTDIEAYRLFLKARSLYLRRSEGDLEGAVEFFKRAIDLDPKFAEAHAGLASTYTAITLWQNQASKEMRALAKRSAATALDFKPHLARALGARCALARQDLEWDGAVENCEKAIANDPSDTVARGSLAATLDMLGEFRRAKQIRDEAGQLDPIYEHLLAAPKLANAFAAGDDRTAAVLATKLLKAKRDFALLAAAMLVVVAREGEPTTDAQRAYRDVIARLSYTGPLVEPVARALASRSAFGDAAAAAREQTTKDAAFEPESVFAMVGDYDRFFEAVKARIAHQDTARLVVWTPFAWRFAISGDAASGRFKEFATSAGMVDYWKKHGWPDRCRPKGEDDFECS
jgi:TolB-like protein/Tfp pilus assembly protein PilF